MSIPVQPAAVTEAEQAAPPSQSFAALQARTQRFTLGTPREFRVSPRGDRVLFLRSPSATEAPHALYSMDTATGTERRLVDPATLGVDEQDVPAEERARRERSRTQGGGVMGYACDVEFTVAAFMLAGRLYGLDLHTAQVSELAASRPVIDPRPDPTGRRVAYVCGGAVHLLDLTSGQDSVLAARAEDESEDVEWGLAEFVAAEEMSRSRGYWFAPDGERLLIARADRSAVPRWHISDPADPSGAPRTVAYPAAGCANVAVTLWFMDIRGERLQVTWDDTAFPYLVEVYWSAAGEPLALVQSRDQRETRILAIGADGATRCLHAETDPHWVEITTGVPAWTELGELVRVGVAAGANRLFVGERDASGDGLQVRSVLDVGADVMFTASPRDSTQVHVYRTAAGAPVRLSTVDGVHSAARGGDTVVLTQLALDQDGARFPLLGTGLQVRSLAMSPPVTPEVRLLALGERGLRAALLLPTDYDPVDGPLPVLLDPYGGPHAQRVLQARGAYVAAQWFADQGFAVLIIDGRGTPGRGPDWEREIAGEFAAVTLADQLDGLRAAAARFVELDLDRVAMRGWSYGGYLSALAVLRAPDVVKAAIAGAPVIDWRLYDTHYTERYLGDPERDPEAYRRNSLLEDAPGLRGKLLLIHGLADDNVFAAHSLRMSQALLAAGRPHEFLPLIGVTHMSPADAQIAENFLNLQVNWLRDALS